MSAARPRPRARLPPRASRSLLAFLVVAVAVGIAATYLAAPAPGAPPGGGELPIHVLGLQSLGWLILALVLVPFAFFVLYRARVRASLVDQRLFLNLLVIALLFIFFLVVARSLSYGTPPPENGTAPPTTPGQNASQYPVSPNVTGPIVGPAPIIPGVPGWVGYTVLGAIVIVAVAIVAYRLRPESVPPELRDGAAEVRARLRRALTDLAAGGSRDPRQVVIALYADLLERIGPNLERLETATPREIALESVTKLGISRAHADTLTGLFEEARYSTHPFAPERVDEARAALAGAIADLAGPPGRPA